MHDHPHMVLNGTLIPTTEATISVADRGFRFGDGLFETIRLHRGVPYQWELHMERLAAGLQALRIPAPAIAWHLHARTLLHHHEATEGFVRIALSRGTGSSGYLPTHASPPTWMIELLPPSPHITTACSLWLSSLARPPLACLPGNQKLSHGINNSLALLEAKDHGADEALQLSVDGRLCEAASANLFWVEGNTLCTPTLETGCLAGTTRAAILRLCGMEYAEVNASLGSLRGADAVFLSNARTGIWPVATLAPQGWNFAEEHPVIRRLTQALSENRDAYTTQHSGDW